MDRTQTYTVRMRARGDPTPIGEPRRGRGLQERVAGGIVEAAARVIAIHGDRANMADVADEAGIARATLYRYFSSRADLLDALSTLAARRAGEGLATARLDELELRVSVERAVRALLDVGDPLVALARARAHPTNREFEDAVEGPLRRLVGRGQTGGELRDDIPAALLTDMLLALVVSALAVRPVLGREDAVAAVSSVYLDGARARPALVVP